MDDRFVNLVEDVILTLLWQSGASESVTVCVVISLSICYWLFKCGVLRVVCVWERESITASCVCVCVSEHVSGAEQERSGHISFRAESAFWRFRSARSIRSAPLAQPKMPFDMGGAREGLAGAPAPPRKTIAPP